MSSGNWAIHGAEIHRRLKPFLKDDDLQTLLERKAWRHFMVTFRLLIVAGLCVYLSLNYLNPLIWIFAGLLQGFNILGFITLLHDALHMAIFDKTRKTGHYIAALLYALPSGISASQFTRWHLDHHAQLGTSDKDPKRAYLTPKVIKRLYKLRYMTPFLFLIYARASALASKEYQDTLKKKIRMEKTFVYSFHMILISLIIITSGFYSLFRIYIFPLFFCFPIAFTINRLGQHYKIDPSDPAKWGTLMNGGFFVNALHLNSNFHLEHHFFPRVPLYKLPQLNRALRPFFISIEHKPSTYRELLWGWFILNKKPHTDWNKN